ncbi:MAG: Dabb family protein [Isosphaerales bacterium]
MLSHNVFFSLNDRSEAAIQKLKGDCRKYLTGHPGMLFFACGTPNQELTRPVNDRDFDVALQIVFDSKPAHDAYQDAPTHERFISENKPNWRLVRVFDVDLEPGSSPKS